MQLDWFPLTQGLSQVTIKVSFGAMVSSQVLTGGGSASKLRHVVWVPTTEYLNPLGLLNWQFQFLTGCWPQAFLNSLPDGPLHRKAHSIAAYLYQSKRCESEKERKKERGRRQNLESFCNLISIVTYYHFGFIFISTASSPFSKGGNYRNMKSRRQRSCGTTLEALPTIIIIVISGK